MYEGCQKQKYNSRHVHPFVPQYWVTSLSWSVWIQSLTREHCKRNKHVTEYRAMINHYTNLWWFESRKKNLTMIIIRLNKRVRVHMTCPPASTVSQSTPPFCAPSWKSLQKGTRDATFDTTNQLVVTCFQNNVALFHEMLGWSQRIFCWIKNHYIDTCPSAPQYLPARIKHNVDTQN